MKGCASCGRDIPESATLCEPCDIWAAEHVATAPSVHEAAHPRVPPSSVSPSAHPSTPAGSVNRRELLLIAAAVVVAGIITLVLLLGRGVPSSEVAAAPGTALTTRTSLDANRQPVSTKPTQAWSTERRMYWTGERRGGAAFELPAENVVTVWMGHVRPLLIVRCMSKRTEAFVFTGSALKIEPETEDHTVSFTFDTEPELTERWPDSAEHDALFAPDGAAFAQRLIHARVLRFGYTPHNSAPVSAEFQMSGLGELIDPAAKECGWKK